VSDFWGGKYIIIIVFDNLVERDNKKIYAKPVNCLCLDERNIIYIIGKIGL